MLFTRSNFLRVINNTSEISQLQTIRSLNQNLEWTSERDFQLCLIIILSLKLVKLSQSLFSVISFEQTSDLSHIQS